MWKSKYITACRITALASEDSLKLINMFSYDNKMRRIILTVMRQPPALEMTDFINLGMQGIYKKPFEGIYSEYGKR